MQDILSLLDQLSSRKLTGNKVELRGYTCGLLGANMFGILTTAFKDNGPSVVPRPDKLLYAKWRFTTSLFPNYADFFGGTTGIVDASEGFGGLYVPSNVEGNGKIQYYQIDKTGLNPGSGNPKRIIGGTGHPYVTGAWPGDYWLFSATDNYEYPAGTNLHIKYLTRVSATGQRYWMLEYFDGNDWKPAEEYPIQTETESGTNAQYNFQEPTANIAVECYWTLAAPCREPMSGPVFEVTDAPADGGGGGGGLKPGTVLFEEDFEWLEPYATAASAPDDVTSNSVGSSPNIFTTEGLQPILATLLEKGYAYIWGGKGMTEWATTEPDSGNGRTLYLQKNYLKFGKSDWSSGLVLPAISSLSSATNIDITFDWCWCMTGGSKPDIMTLTAEVAGGEIVELSSTQPTEGDQTKLEWQHASASFNGITAESRIVLRPTNVDPYVSNTRGQNRWYLDNIKIVVR